MADPLSSTKEEEAIFKKYKAAEKTLFNKYSKLDQTNPSVVKAANKEEAELRSSYVKMFGSSKRFTRMLNAYLKRTN